MTLQEAVLDPFGKGNEAEVVEGIKIETDPNIERILSDFEELNKIEELGDIESKLKQTEYETLTPLQIDLTLQKIINEYELTEDQATAGLLITKLIQDSYDSGNNGFVLTTKDTLINSIGYNLIGNEGNRIEIEVKGNVGNGCGINSNYISLEIVGDVGDWCGYLTTNSVFSIGMDVGDCCGYLTTNSAFSIERDVGNNCGLKSKNSTFKTPNIDTYKKIKQSIGFSDRLIRGNKVILIK